MGSTPENFELGALKKQSLWIRKTFTILQQSAGLCNQTLGPQQALNMKHATRNPLDCLISHPSKLTPEILSSSRFTASGPHSSQRCLRSPVHSSPRMSSGGLPHPSIPPIWVAPSTLAFEFLLTMRAALFVSSSNCADSVILARFLVLGLLAEVELVRETAFAVEAWAAVVTSLGLAHPW